MRVQKFASRLRARYQTYLIMVTQATDIMVIHHKMYRCWPLRPRKIPQRQASAEHSMRMFVDLPAPGRELSW